MQCTQLSMKPIAEGQMFAPLITESSVHVGTHVPPLSSPKAQPVMPLYPDKVIRHRLRCLECNKQLSDYKGLAGHYQRLSEEMEGLVCNNSIENNYNCWNVQYHRPGNNESISICFALCSFVIYRCVRCAQCCYPTSAATGLTSVFMPTSPLIAALSVVRWVAPWTYRSMWRRTVFTMHARLAISKSILKYMLLLGPWMGLGGYISQKCSITLAPFSKSFVFFQVSSLWYGFHVI